ncbi:MAG: TetR/AcrR family transcriptional regulator [Bacteroidia bacterium]
MHSKHDINAIIAKGSELFRKKGYHVVGINEILESCEVPKGSFYNFFKSKEDFGTKAVAWYGDSQVAYITQMMKPENGSPLERLRFFYKALINKNEEEGLNAGCLVHNVATELGGMEGALGAEADKQFQRWMVIFGATISEGQAQGQIRKDFTPHALATFLHTGIYGAFSLMKAQRSRKPLDQWFNMVFTFISI